MSSHLWLVSPWQGSTEPADVAADCHRRLRGPYTGLNSVLRALVPTIDERYPELVRRHVIAILSVSPELRGTIDAEPATLTSLALPNERTRVYPANRTRRHAHGIVELLEAYTELAGIERLTLRFGNVDQADHTDQEFLAIALRRARSGRVRLLVETRSDELTEELATALAQHARRVVVPSPPAAQEHRDADTLLRAYVASDGTSRDPAEIAAHAAADPAVVARLHDERVAALTARDEVSLTLGAIPYHLEHGSDSRAAAGMALSAAAEYCFDFGFYHILLELGARGRAIIDPVEQREPYWFLSTKMTTALAAIGRSEETEEMYLELAMLGTDPKVQMSCCYAMAMMYTRHHAEGRRNHRLAKALLNTAVTIAKLLPDHDDRVFFTVFQQNGLALAETHLGNLTEALRLVSEGLVLLDAELPGQKHLLHRSVLVNNRAKVFMVLGRLAKSLADLDSVIEKDPNYPDYYFDRADVRRKLGDTAGAIADYDHAMTLTPPFLELHYNRGDLRAELGDLAGAVADLSYVVELEPDQLDARVNLVGLLLERGAPAEAGRYIDEGLRMHPDDARLLHARGLAAQENGDPPGARRDFDRALDIDPRFVAALVSRAVLRYELDDHDGATADLDAAVGIDAGNPDLLYNRGFVHQAAGRFDDAVRDYTDALALPGADQDELLRQRELCHAQLVSAP